MTTKCPIKPNYNHLGILPGSSCPLCSYDIGDEGQILNVPALASFLALSPATCTHEALLPRNTISAAKYLYVVTIRTKKAK